MTLKDAIAWAAENCARIEFGTHPRTGKLDIAIYCVGWRRLTPKELVDGDAAASLVNLITRIVKSQNE